MKICLLTTSYPRYEGDYRGIFVYKLAKALEKKVDVDIITIKGYKSLTSGSGILPNLSNSWKVRLSFLVYWAHFYLKIIFNALKSDLIHANWRLLLS